ncbi:molecular chaperone [Proteus sp. FME41]|uniref:fimbrial biogenesis chaperone n=1 Tax=Proteus sp. FME41 TaxID=2742608 RepID=UPI001868F02D|nr:molecular chaperone [Proteus sp. FME41]
MKRVGIFILLMCFSIIASANLALDGSRVVLYHSDREASLNIKNDGEYPVVIQTWVDDGNPDNTPETITDVSALSLPPVLQLKPSESQLVRVINKFTNMDKEKETLYWLNLYEITPKPVNKKEDENLINVVVRLQIKVFYRPDNLMMKISEVSESLKFTKSDKLLTIENPTSFYVTVKSAFGENNPNIIIPMLAPFSKQQAVLENNQINQISYVLIDDFGGEFQNKREIK